MKLQFSVKSLVRELEDITDKTFSFAQLGSESNVDPRYVSKWVQGDADHLRFEQVEKFLSYLQEQGVDVSKHCLFTVTNEPAPSGDKSTTP